MLIIGSLALQHQGALPKGRIPLDLDAIGSKAELKTFLKAKEVVKMMNTTPKYITDRITHTSFEFKDGSLLDWEFAEEGSVGWELLKACGAIDGVGYADINTLYTLKMSHRFKKDSIHFYKTMSDIKYLRKLGATITCPEWYKAREKETYSYKHPALNVSKEDFFKDDNIPYKYDHDTIHLAVAVDYMSPAYNKFKPDENEVLCSKDMFDKCDYETKLLSVVEESMVLALERSLVPYDFKPDPREIFKYALMKVCTSITSGWWRDWAWENHDEALEYFDTELGEGYMRTKLEEGLSKGVVKNFK